MIIEYIWIFLCIWVLSFIASCVLTLFSRTPTSQKIFNAFFFLGIAVHELSHYLMCLLTHVPVEKARILPDKDKDGGLKGFIKPAQPPNFLQSLLIGFAPLFVGTYIIGFIIHYIASPGVNYTIAAILIYVAISILTQISPSGADMRYIFTSLKLFSKYALIQTTILIIALAISYLIIIYYEIFMFDYLVVLSMLSMGFYYVVKYSGIGLTHMLSLINFNLKKIRYTKSKAIYQGIITRDFRDFIVKLPEIKSQIIEKLRQEGLYADDDNKHQYVYDYIDKFYEENGRGPNTTELYQKFLNFKS